MKRWEYMVVPVGWLQPALMADLDKHGVQGWELVAIRLQSTSDQYGHTYSYQEGIFKREAVPA